LTDVVGRPSHGASLAVAGRECQPDDPLRTTRETSTVPTYQYACTNPEGKHEFEVVQSFSDAPVSECPECGSPVRKVYGSVGVVFKGSGFYRTDSRKSASSSESSSGSSSSNGSGSKDSSSSSSSSSKDSSSSSSTTTSSGGGSKAAS
jgi:putative FmdB family regulatory protein